MSSQPNVYGKRVLIISKATPSDLGNPVIINSYTPWKRLTWNLNMGLWKTMVLYKPGVVFRFYVGLFQGAIIRSIVACGAKIPSRLV